MRHLYLFLSFIFFCRLVLADVSGEPGKPFLKTFIPEEYASHPQNWDVAQDSRGIIYIANTLGILEYDGINWRTIKHPTKAYFYSVAISSDDIIYTGCSGDLGYLRPDSSCSWRFTSLLSEVPEKFKDLDRITHTVATQQGIFFLGRHCLFQWQQEVKKIGHSDETDYSGTMRVIEFSKENPITYIAYINNTLILRQSGYGLMQLQDNELIPLNKDYGIFAEKNVSSIIPFNEDAIMVTTYKQGIYLVTEKSAHLYRSEITDYAIDHFTRGCTRLPEDRYVLSTNNMGIVLFDREGNILSVINKSLGLPDNSVRSSCFLDLQGGLWVPLDYGLARIELESPLVYYDGKEGLEGFILAIARHNGILHVGTGQGLYYMSMPRQSGGLVDFRKIRQINDFCRDLLSFRGHLLVATDDGIYEVKPDRSLDRLYKECTCRLIASQSGNMIYAGTMEHGVQVFLYRNSRFIPLGRIEQTSDRIRRIVEDRSGDLWITAQSAHQFHIEKISVQQRNPLSSKVTIYDSTRGVPENFQQEPFIWHDQLFVGVLSRGLLRYNEKSDLFEPDYSLGEEVFSEQSGVVYPAVDARDHLWFLMADNLVARAEITDKGECQLTYPLLRALTRDYYKFYPDGDGSLVWAGSSDGRLIRYDEKADHPDTTDFAALIRKVTVSGDSVIYGGTFIPNWENPVIPFSSNALRFDYAMPRYNASDANEYQYRMVGLDDDWSGWTKESYRDYTSLREGNYRFEVHGKDVFGSISDSGTFDFRILPPWYKTNWMFAAYIISFILLVYGIVAIRIYRIEAQKRHLENIVKLRTTELAEANYKIQQYNEQLEQVLEERTRNLILSERQAVFGQMVQGIVHNLRNPLTVSSGGVQLLSIMTDNVSKRNLDNRKETVRALDDLVKQVVESATLIEGSNNKLNSMITSMMTKSRTDKSGDSEVVDLNSIIRTELDFMKADNFYRNKVKKSIKLSKRSLLIQVVPGELAQVFGNIVRNALDAMYNLEKPSLSISTRFENKKTQFVISDNGPGIPNDIIDRIFDPFFTTKMAAEDKEDSPEQPSGTGLGLWMCREAIESFDGSIKVSSETGKGATFSITLPLHTEKSS
ncbi:MAG: ATP-binding protein [Candidatus Electryonea clarkiae]|nr:ATP-binding protein [Candidatus Electryonea clarkiae]MDP8286521.1 ATP-binding protein [Candidatus Electryonea clarkiae]